MKRKAASNASSGLKKKVKADSLPWKSVNYGAELLDDADLLLGFEEVEGVTVEYSEEGPTKIAKFLMNAAAASNAASEDEEEWVPIADSEDHAAPVASTSKLACLDNNAFQSS
jgi:hypothetical protein